MHTERNQYFANFDWLRFALALIVMAYHGKLISWHYAGNLSVQVFFALSGWLIARILIELKKENLPRFYYNRVLRIWIPYYFALALLLGASFFKDPINYKWFEIVSYKTFFVYNIFGIPQLTEHKLEMPLDASASYFWSVNAEEQFYLLAPLLLLMSPSKLRKNLLLWLGVSTFLLLIHQYASIAFGVTAAVFDSKYPDFYLVLKNRIFICISLLFCSTALISNYNYELVAPFFAVFLVLLLADRRKQNKVAAFFGGLSYPLYLNHWIGMYVSNFLLSPYGLRDSLIGKVLACILNVIIAGIFYQYIDKKIFRYRDTLYTEKLGEICLQISYIFVGIGLVLGFFLFPIKLS